MRVSGVPPEFIAAAAGSITLLAMDNDDRKLWSDLRSDRDGCTPDRPDENIQYCHDNQRGCRYHTLAPLWTWPFAMAITMAVSELVYIACCFVASRRILSANPDQLGIFTTSVGRELIRFAGSYQLVNALEVALLPVSSGHRFEVFWRRYCWCLCGCSEACHSSVDGSRCIDSPFAVWWDSSCLPRVPLKG